MREHGRFPQIPADAHMAAGSPGSEENNIGAGQDDIHQPCRGTDRERYSIGSGLE